MPIKPKNHAHNNTNRTLLLTAFSSFTFFKDIIERPPLAGSELTLQYSLPQSCRSIISARGTLQPPRMFRLNCHKPADFTSNLIWLPGAHLRHYASTAHCLKPDTIGVRLQTQRRPAGFSKTDGQHSAGNSAPVFRSGRAKALAKKITFD